jgi:uncharacterized membrane protein
MLWFALIMHFVLLFSIASAVSNDGGVSGSSRSTARIILISTVFLMIDSLELFGLNTSTKQIQSPHRKQKQRTVMSIFEEMGPNYMCCAYWIDESSFW